MMEELDELEVKIITTFNDFVYSHLSSVFPNENLSRKVKSSELIAIWSFIQVYMEKIL